MKLLLVVCMVAMILVKGRDDQRGVIRMRRLREDGEVVTTVKLMEIGMHSYGEILTWECGSCGHDLGILCRGRVVFLDENDDRDAQRVRRSVVMIECTLGEIDR